MISIEQFRGANGWIDLKAFREAEIACGQRCFACGLITMLGERIGGPVRCEECRAWWATEPALIDEIKRQLRQSHFKYLDLEQAEVRHVIPIDSNGCVAVLANGGMATYEWIGRHGGDFHGGPPGPFEHSDCGYGSSEAALRDGLVHFVD